jgi:DNA-binding MarR family transcriptional regulator
MDNQELQFHTTEDTEVRLMRLMRRIWSMPAGDFQRGEIDVTLPQLRLIRYVSQNSGCHLQDIAEGLKLTPPTVSVGIRKLEEGGWLERRPDPEDGRATCVFLTRKSERVVREAVAHQKKFTEIFFSGLSSAEQEQMLNLLEKGVLSVERHLSKE